MKQNLQISQKDQKKKRFVLDLYQQVIKRFLDHIPIKEIAKQLSVSEVKVRRILITEGLCESTTSKEIVSPAVQSLSTEEIADRLRKPVKTVQAYMPYLRGEYGENNTTSNAARIRNYRSRNRQFAKNQVYRKETNVMNKKKNAQDPINTPMKLYRLYLSFSDQPDPEGLKVLERFGKAKDGVISREFLVSSKLARPDRCLFSLP